MTSTYKESILHTLSIFHYKVQLSFGNKTLSYK